MMVMVHHIIKMDKLNTQVSGKTESNMDMEAIMMRMGL